MGGDAAADLSTPEFHITFGEFLVPNASCLMKPGRQASGRDALVGDVGELEGVRMRLQLGRQVLEQRGLRACSHTAAA